MGNKVTILENRTSYNIEIKMWVDPSRPDQFKKVVRIKPGRSVRLKATTFSTDDQCGLEQNVLLMVYANGGWTGTCFLPLQMFAYAKVSCDRNQHGQVILRAKRAYSNFFRHKCFTFFPAKCVGLGMDEEDI